MDATEGIRKTTAEKPKVSLQFSLIPDSLPLSYQPIISNVFWMRLRGFEPLSLAWKAKVLTVRLQSQTSFATHSPRRYLRTTIASLIAISYCFSYKSL